MKIPKTIFDKPISISKDKITFDEVYDFIKSLHLRYKFEIIGGLKRRGWTKNDIDYILYAPTPRNLAGWDKYLLPIMVHFHKRVDCFIPTKHGYTMDYDWEDNFTYKTKADYNIGSLAPDDGKVHLKEGGYVYLATLGSLTKKSMRDAEKVMNLRKKHWEEYHRFNKK